MKASKTPPDSVKMPLTGSAPIFDQPWHARAFALAVHLHERGSLPWGQWTEQFARHIENLEKSGEIRDNDDYYRLWLETLEQFADRLN